MADQSESKPIITAQESEVVRKYVSLSSRLRNDYDNMKRSNAFTKLSSQCGFNTALDEEGVNDLIRCVVDHAGRWPGIEQEMLGLCQEVFAYADNFSTISGFVVGKIKSLPGYASSSSKLDDLPENAWEGEADPLGTSDLPMIPSIKEAVSAMSEEISSLKVTGGNLKEHVLDFKIELMNIIQTGLRKITQLDTINELEEELLRIGMSRDEQLIVRGHMHNVTSVFSEVVRQSYLLDNKIPNMSLIDYYKEDYNNVLQHLPPENKANIEKLVLKMRSDAVLTQHFAAFHDAVEQLDKPLVSADKGIGQVRTLWTTTLDVVQGAQDRVLQVTSFSILKRIEKSLSSAAEKWRSARGNAEALYALLKPSC